MISVSGYKQLQLIHQGGHNLVYRGTRERDGETVILRQLRPEIASPQLVARYRKEFELLSQVQSPYVIQAFELIEEAESPILVTENPSGQPLNELLAEGLLTFTEAANVARLIALAIEDLHSHRVVHKDINPANVIYDRERERLKLIDFGISSFISPTQVEVDLSRGVEGTLHYLSPEQTGRMNRSVDYRADFYALGVTLYQMLTGKLPFHSEDGLELIYQHITLMPAKPVREEEDVPDALSRITLKLLSKMPEDRYQSAFSIAQDLSHYLERALLGDANPDFEVALDDIAEQLNISERLLERDSHQVELLTILDAVSRGENQTAILVGGTGVGKTTLLKEFEREAGTRGAYVARGSYNPITIEVPYSAAATALDDLGRQLLAHSQFNAGHDDIRKKLTGLEHPMVDLAPELGVALDVKVRAGELTAGEAKNRLVRGLTVLLNSIATESTPLIICLDNIQWVDEASLDLFEELFFEDRLPYVLLLGAYRSQELDPENTTRKAVYALLERKPDIQLIRLDNLSLNAVNLLVSESLFRPEEDTLEFSKLLVEKTDGNPLAVKEFLQQLYADGLLSFNRTHREWEWDTPTITAQPPSENVSDALIDQLQNLDEATSRLLQIASCIGAEFDLELLQVVSGLSFSETSTRLSHAIQQGYLLQVPSSAGGRDKRILFRFSHERIQQTAYTLLPVKERRQLHASIGQAILQSGQEYSGSRLFDVVNQLNSSFESPDLTIVDPVRLAELNLRAGDRAKQAAAFQNAFKYYRTAIALFGQHAWAQYDRCLTAHLEAAECAYLCGDENQVDLLIASILDHARSPVDKARAYEVKIRSLIASFNPEEAIETALRALTELGVDVPRSFNPKMLQRLAFVFYQTYQLTRNEQEKLPAMEDETHLAAMKVFTGLCHAAYLTGDQRIGLYVLEMGYLSLKHGTAPESSIAYPMLGAVFISYLGTIDQGYRLGRMALDNLNDDNKNLHARTISLAVNFVTTWKDHLNTSLEPLSRAYRIGMETQDIEFALIAAVTGSANAFVLGHELQSIESNLTEQTREAKQHQQIPMYYMGVVYQQAIRQLLGDISEPWMLNGDVFQEEELAANTLSATNDSSIANMFIIKMYLAVLFGRPTEAVKYGSLVRQSYNSVDSSPVVPFYIFIESLALIMNLDNVGGVVYAQHRFRIWRNLRLLRKWSHHSPENMMHRFNLVSAALSSHFGRELTAINNFENAIQQASDHGYLNDLALATEMTGRFYLANGKRNLALHYLGNALSHYKRWGANNKVITLQREFSELASQATSRSTAPESDFVYGSDKLMGSETYIDLETVIRASQVLSGEMVLENLLERMMEVALINAGGHKASLVLNTGNQLSIEITTWMREGKMEYRFESIALESANNLPISVIQYVARTQEEVVLNNPVSEDIFTQDEYILRERPRSILCIPLQSQAHLTGILYLENTETTHAFTQDRISILKLLASQAAIAIENAKLYQQLNDSRNKYVSLYENAVEGIFEVDESGNINNINPAAAHLLGYDGMDQLRDAAQPAISAAFVNPHDFETFRARIAATGRVVDFETQLLTREGDSIWVALSGQVFLDSETNKPRMEGSIVDISERKRREEAEQARIMAEAATQTKSQFLANMSHEIRTPMNAIIGYTDLALETELSQDQADYLHTIRNSSQHLLRVVNDILDLSRVESGKLELQESDFHLSTIFLDLENLFGLEASNKGIKLVLPAIDEDTERTYVGDPIRIGQVLINLVGNAMKFTDEGKITVSWEGKQLDDEKAKLTFTVKDDGRGIEPAKLESIFESFSQVDVTPSETGTGLGLTISRRLAEMMGGELNANSKPGLGSTFYFTAVVDVVERRTKVRETSEPRDVSVLAGREILLVEDNEINQKLAMRMLARLELDVTLAEHGREALDNLETRSFPVVLMDIRMPVMDGIETIKHIRANSEWDNMKVVALSAGVLNTEVEEALASGFDHYLPKPIDFKELSSLLTDIMPVAASADTETDYVINGVNFGKAIDNHGGDMEFLLTLTQDFVDIYGNADKEFKRLFTEQETEKAERLAHNLAGICGTFGADNLMDVSRQIEHQIQATTLADEETLTRFAFELGNFTEAIATLQAKERAEAAQQA